MLLLNMLCVCFHVCINMLTTAAFNIMETVEKKRAQSIGFVRTD